MITLVLRVPLATLVRQLALLSLLFRIHSVILSLSSLITYIQSYDPMPTVLWSGLFSGFWFKCDPRVWQFYSGRLFLCKRAFCCKYSLNPSRLLISVFLVKNFAHSGFGGLYAHTLHCRALMFSSLAISPNINRAICVLSKCNYLSDRISKEKKVD